MEKNNDSIKNKLFSGAFVDYRKITKEEIELLSKNFKIKIIDNVDNGIYSSNNFIQIFTEIDDIEFNLSSRIISNSVTMTDDFYTEYILNSNYYFYNNSAMEIKNIFLSIYDVIDFLLKFIVDKKSNSNNSIEQEIKKAFHFCIMQRNLDKMRLNNFFKLISETDFIDNLIDEINGYSEIELPRIDRFIDENFDEYVNLANKIYKTL